MKAHMYVSPNLSFLLLTSLSTLGHPRAYSREGNDWYPSIRILSMKHRSYRTCDGLPALLSEADVSTKNITGYVMHPLVAS